MSDLFLLQNNQIIDLFEIKLSDFEGFLRFHGSKNFDIDLVFNGVSYMYIPCELSLVEFNSEGKQNRPIFSIANVNNYITNIMKDRQSLIGRRVFRKRVLARDLDEVNFDSTRQLGDKTKNTFGNKILSTYISSETYTINQKNIEDRDKVEFTLSNVLDIQGAAVPRRKVYNNFCQWEYRGCGCNYGKFFNSAGPAVNHCSYEWDDLAKVCDEYYDLVDTQDKIKTKLKFWVDGTNAVKDDTFEKYTHVDSEGKVIKEYKKNELVKPANVESNGWPDKAGTIRANHTATPTILFGLPKVYTRQSANPFKEGSSDITGVLFSVIVF